MKRPVSNVSVCLLWVLLTAFSSVSEAKRPFIPFPDDVRVLIVGENMIVNGLPLMAYEFHSRQSIDEISKFYTDYWQDNSEDSDAEQPYLESSFAGWEILSRLEQEHNITVQLQKDGIKGIKVLVGVSPLPKYLLDNKKPKVEYKIPTLGGMTIQSFIQSEDRGVKTETYWVESRDSVESSTNKLENYYDKRDYQVNKKRTVKAESQLTYATTMTVSNNRESIRFDTVEVEGITRIVAVRKGD